MTDYLINFLTTFLIFSMLTLCLNVVTGYIGYLNLGHVGIWAVGSYAYALLALKGVPYLAAMLGGGVAAALAGFLIGLPTLRLKSHYIAIASLGLSYIVYSLLLNLTDLTRGPLGLPGIPRPAFFSVSFGTPLMYFLLTLVVSAVVGFLLYRILHSPFGKILETIREDEIAAKALGKNTYAYKLQAFVLSSFFVGVISALSASFFQYISPLGFQVEQLVFFLAALMVGGAGSFWGSFAGVFFIFGVQELLRFVELSPNIIGPLRTMVYALILVLVMLFKPEGLMGKKLKVYQR
jgi:branched-chain amino acid transport system permease protein